MAFGVVWPLVRLGRPPSRGRSSGHCLLALLLCVALYGALGVALVCASCLLLACVVGVGDAVFPAASYFSFLLVLCKRRIVPSWYPHVEAIPTAHHEGFACVCGYSGNCAFLRLGRKQRRQQEEPGAFAPSAFAISHSLSRCSCLHLLLPQALS